MNSEPFLAVMPVIQACESLGIRYYIGGSLASSFYGSPRSTNDVDVVSDLQPGQADAFAQLLASEYYVDAQMIRTSLTKGISSNLIHLATMVKIDLYDLESMPFTREALLRCRTELVLGEDRPMNFATPEDVLLAKLCWFRQGGERSERQWSDLLGLIRVQGSSLDSGYIDRWIDILAIDDLYRRLRSES